MSGDEKFTEYKYDKVPVQEKVSEEQDVPKYGYGVRHIQLVIFLLCLTVSFLARAHMGVTIVAMTHNNDNIEINLVNNATTHIRIQDDLNTLEDDLNYTRIKIDVDNYITSEANKNKVIKSVTAVDMNGAKITTYDWPKSTQEMVLSAFFFGYFLMMFPAGMVCQRWGGKLPLQIGLFTNGVASILAPWLTLWGGWKALCFCRFLQGLGQAGTLPSIQTLLAKWVPASERATLSSYVYTGTSIGSIIAFQLGGVLGDSRLGWPATFWAVGGICLFCFTIISVFGAATPLEHNTISEAEKEFILGKTGDRSVRKPRTPWRAIMKSKPLWGTLTTHVGSTIAYVFFFQQTPSYIHYILGTDVKSSGLLTSLPYIASFFCSIGFGILSDYCTNNNIVSLRNARRISNSISQFGIAISLLSVSYTTNINIAMTILVISMSTNTALHTGWMVNHIDLAPNYSGTLMAIGNTFSNFFTVLLPVLVSYIITDMTNVTQWRIMFFIIAILCFLTNVVFICLMSSDIQPWNYDETNEICVEEQKILENISETEKKECHTENKC